MREAQELRESNERRGNARFSMRLPVTVHNPGASASPLPNGTTLNISSNGLLFQTAEELKTGQHILVSVEWPVRLDNRIPLTLVLRGKVLRCEQGIAAMQTQRHEFKTRKLNGQSRSAE